MTTLKKRIFSLKIFFVKNKNEKYLNGSFWTKNFLL